MEHGQIYRLLIALKCLFCCKSVSLVLLEYKSTYYGLFMYIFSSEEDSL